MPKIPDAHKETVQSHLPSGETIKSAHSDGLDTMVVTGSRLFTVTSGERGDKKARRTQAIAFDEVTSVTVDVLEDGSANVALLIFAAILGIGAVVLMLPSTGGGAIVFVGLILALGAVGVAGVALDTDDGHIEVTVRTNNDDDTHSYTLQRDAEDVAAAISEQAAT
jgi:hypothetical protein